jgi:hypothetical protein
VLASLQPTYQQIVAAVGRNQLVNVKLVLHLFRRQFAGQMEKLLLP